MFKYTYEYKPCICGGIEYEFSSKMIDMACCKNCGLLYIYDSCIVKEPKVRLIKEDKQEK